jgi:hypothetical protein
MKALLSILTDIVTAPVHKTPNMNIYKYHVSPSKIYAINYYKS